MISVLDLMLFFGLANLQLLFFYEIIWLEDGGEEAEPRL